MNEELIRTKPIFTNEKLIYEYIKEMIEDV